MKHIQEEAGEMGHHPWSEASLGAPAPVDVLSAHAGRAGRGSALQLYSPSKDRQFLNLQSQLCLSAPYLAGMSLVWKGRCCGSPAHTCQPATKYGQSVGLQHLECFGETPRAQQCLPAVCLFSWECGYLYLAGVVGVYLGLPCPTSLVQLHFQVCLSSSESSEMEKDRVI
ncbi:hypothetical protein P7K49_030804 [Saguinus oedipus]|uniref:Uncharacterized protein n=1 Tax=Saguinus oedipus TaxID=9490 RepID=A0ABQ9U377_SAGOE|nr:hypothetical protein P7K49_030804 [Saguinus oedipus]